MNFEEKIKELLFNHGMFENQANAVIKIMKEDKAMVNRWNDDTGEYPDSVLNVLWLSVKAAALEYIDENCPLAWFRSLFVSER